MVKSKQKSRLRNQVARHAIDTVVPRKRNGYRPYLTNRYGMTLIVLMVFAVCVSYVQQSPAILGAEAAIQPTRLLDDINRERATENLAPLVINEKLTAAAQAKADDMIANQYWAHESPTGVTPWKWINGAGYHYAYAGENLAKNFASADSTVAAWMASEGHRKNIMHDSYTEAGFAVIDSELDGANTTLVVGIFASPAASLSTVAGAKTYAPGTASINPFARFGIILQSSNSTTVGIIGLMTIALIVSLVAFVLTHLRSTTKKRGKARTQNSPWYQDRPATKLLILTILTIGVSVFLGSGQI